MACDKFRENGALPHRQHSTVPVTKDKSPIKVPKCNIKVSSQLPAEKNCIINRIIIHLVKKHISQGQLLSLVGILTITHTPPCTSEVLMWVFIIVVKPFARK